MSFPADYTKYQIVTIDYTKVDATLAYYPCLIDLADLNKTTDIFDTCRSDGGDIRVTLSDGTTQLAREVVSIDTSAKTGELHVKIPSLSSSVNTVIHIWYNGTDTEPAIDSTYGAENVWHDGTSGGPDFRAVHHMGDTTTSTITDSTANSNDGTKTAANEPIEAAGHIGSAQDFSGYAAAEKIDCGNGSSLDLGDVAQSMQVIFKPTTLINDAANLTLALMSRADSVVFAENDWLLYFEGSDDGRVRFGTWGGNIQTATDSWANNVFHHLTATYTSGSVADLFVNGASDIYNSDTNPGTIDGTVNNKLWIGWYDDTNSATDGWWDGIIDEVRILATALAATWVSTEFNNHDSPSTFYSVGDEQTSGGSTLLPNDVINMSDSIALKIEINKSDTITLSDSIIKNLGLNKSDSISMSDNISHVSSFVRSLSDTINLTDGLLKSVEIILSDTINLSDNFNSIITLILSLNDSITMSDSIIKSVNISKSDAITLSDEIIKTFGLSKTDTINLSDVISKSIETSRSDTINMADNFNSLITLILALNDTINMSDAISKEIDLVKSDTINLSDNIIKSFGLTKSDIINLADNFSTDADVIYALLNFIARNKTFDFIAKSKTFNFNAKNKTFNFDAKTRGTE